MASINFFNSKEVEWKDLAVHIAGAPITKLRNIKFKSSMEKESLKGAGDQPISIQSGNRDYSGTLEIYAGALRDLNAAAIAAGGKDCLDIAFDVVVSYKAAAGRPLLMRTLVGVQLQEFEEGMAQGDRSSVITLPFLFLDVVGV